MKTLDKLTSKELYKLAHEKWLEEDTKKVKHALCYCHSCQTNTRIVKWKQLIRYYYDNCPYTPNYNKSDELALICPKCNVLNRFIIDKDLENKIKEKLPKDIMNVDEYDGYGKVTYKEKGNYQICPYKGYINI